MQKWSPFVYTRKPRVRNRLVTCPNVPYPYSSKLLARFATEFVLNHYKQ